ncbi:MAG: hypothetical protein DRO11_00080 [Methanobacteriota archaeon]|nr:MAG: hypothetical protein DRO11_00080 [Euryarchaeota archaeon]
MLFRSHFLAGLTLGTIVVIIIWTMGQNISFETLLLGFILVAVGSILPDLDMPRSKPSKALKLSSLILIVIGLKIFRLFLVGLLLLVVTLVCNRLGHRGLMHRPGTAIMATLATFVFFAMGHRPVCEAWLLGICLGLGYSLHLVLDRT